MITASNNDNLVAVVTNPKSTSRLSVPLYHNGGLQSTLTHKAIGELRSLVFSGNHLCGLVRDEDARTTTVVAWNVTRGVVEHTLQEDDFKILDISATSSCLLVLTLKGSKLYVQEYSLDSKFKMLRKIKAGKADDDSTVMEVAASDKLVAVRVGATVKVMDRESGNKVYKCKLASEQGGKLVMNDKYVAACTPSQVQVFKEGKVKTELTLSEAPTQLQLQGGYLLVDQSIYAIGSSKTATPASTMDQEEDATIQLSFCNDTEVQAIVQGPKGGVGLFTLPFVQDGEMLEAISLPKEDEQMEEASTSTKRPATSSVTQTLGPGQAGSESLDVNDRPAKKSKSTGEEEAEEPTIAERLQRLQQVLDQEDEEEEIKFRPKQATTESLSHLLHQALSSSDDSMLELALDVRDAKVRQHSIDDLAVDQATLLLNKLTARLAKKPSRASALVPWIQLVLLSGKIQSSSPLLPLKNLVQERIEVFPQLLQLEGRLSMLANMT
jgi:hypothetical protein